MNNRLKLQIEEFWKTRNRTERYWKKLSKEAFKVADKNGLEIAVTEKLAPVKKNTIILYKNKNEINDIKLLDLVKKDFPALYRKYEKNYLRQKKIKENLIKIYS